MQDLKSKRNWNFVCKTLGRSKVSENRNQKKLKQKPKKSKPNVLKDTFLKGRRSNKFGGRYSTSLKIGGGEVQDVFFEELTTLVPILNLFCCFWKSYTTLLVYTCISFKFYNNSFIKTNANLFSSYILPRVAFLPSYTICSSFSIRYSSYKNSLIIKFTTIFSKPNLVRIFFSNPTWCEWNFLIFLKIVPHSSLGGP